MKPALPSLIVLFLILGPCPIYGQDVIHVDAKTIQQHIDHNAFPAYPPAAKAKHIQGTVLFDLRIAASGKIESMKVVSGDPMLQQAAIDCLKQWTFHPFLKDGVPVVAEGQYSLIYVLSDQSNTTVGMGPQSAVPVHAVTVHVLSADGAQGPDIELNDQFDKAQKACKKEVLSQQFNNTVVSGCKNAAELAEKLPMDGNYVTKRWAYLDAATAYFQVGAFKDALPWADKAVEVVKLGFDSSEATSAAYSTKGAIEGNLGDFPSADQDLTLAEDSLRKQVSLIEKESSSLHGQYAGSLARCLQFHAGMLQAMGRAEDAKQKLAEAAKYRAPNP